MKSEDTYHFHCIFTGFSGFSYHFSGFDMNFHRFSGFSGFGNYATVLCLAIVLKPSKTWKPVKIHIKTWEMIWKTWETCENTMKSEFVCSRTHVWGGSICGLHNCPFAARLVSGSRGENLIEFSLNCNWKWNDINLGWSRRESDWFLFKFQLKMKGH